MRKCKIKGRMRYLGIRLRRLWRIILMKGLLGCMRSIGGRRVGSWRIRVRLL